MAPFPPYDVGFWVNRVGPEILKRYQKVGRVPGDDAGYCDWPARIQYDIVVKGLDPEESLRVHLLELDEALGINSSGEGEPLPPPSPNPAIEPLRANGLQLQMAVSGTPWFGLGTTAFPLLQQYLDGGPGAVTPFFDWMDRSRLSVARALGMFNGGLGRFIPGMYWAGNGYLKGLLSLTRLMHSRGLYLKFSVFADVQNGINLGNHTVPEFYQLVGETLRQEANVLLDGGNEYPKNGWDPQSLSRLAGVNYLQSRGSSLGDALPPVNPWDFFDVHPSRNDDWPKGCKSVYDIQIGQTSEGIALRVPGGIDEPIGIGELGESGKTTNNVNDCYDFGAGCKLFGSFLILHVRTGAFLNLPGSVAHACVQASVQGAQDVPDWALLGSYTRGGLNDFPLEDSPLDGGGNPTTWLRAYGKIQGNRAVVVIFRPTPNVRIVPVGGWRINRQSGTRHNVVVLER